MSDIDPEAQKAFDAIHLFCNGEHVPPPPKYRDDEGFVMDCSRVCGWIAHALFQPDCDGDNVIRSAFFEHGLSKALHIPSHGVLNHEDNVVDTTSWSIEEMTGALTTCLDIAARASKLSDEEGQSKRYAGMERLVLPEVADKIIAKILAVMFRTGGRMAGDGEGWPKVRVSHVTVANRIMLELLGKITGDRMAVNLSSRLSPVDIITYPNSANRVSDLDAAIYAITRISAAIDQVGKAYHWQASTKRIKIDNDRKEAEAAAECDTLKAEIIEMHAESLRLDARPGAQVVLSFLENDLPMPTYKSSVKRPRPERDAIIDQLHDFIGETAYDVLRNLIPEEKNRKVVGYRGLKETLSTIYSVKAPAPL